MVPPLPRSQRPRLAVTTVGSHQHAALLGQVDGIAVSTWPPDIHVVLAASDRELARNRLPIRSDRWETVLPRLQTTRLSPERARIDTLLLAVDEAVAAGAEIVVHLDVRCIVAPDLLQAYAEAALEDADPLPTVWFADVRPLVPPGPLGYPVGPELDRCEARRTDDVERDDPPAACETSFAVRAHDWPQIRDAWERLTLSPCSTATSIDAVESLGGRGVRVAARAYRQHPRAMTARYVSESGDHMVDART